jgi:hypothetical protein
MAKIDRSIYIEASSEEIDAVALDPRRIPEWYAGVENLEADSLFPEVGGKASFTFRLAGITLNLDIVSVKLDRGEQFVYRIEGILQGLSRWSYIPEGTGTRLDVTQIYVMGAFGILADQLVLEQKLQEDLERSLRTLAALVHSEKAYHTQDA